jgi:hypothetical protein
LTSALERTVEDKSILPTVLLDNMVREIPGFAEWVSLFMSCHFCDISCLHKVMHFPVINCKLRVLHQSPLCPTE